MQDLPHLVVSISAALDAYFDEGVDIQFFDSNKSSLERRGIFLEEWPSGKAWRQSVGESLGGSKPPSSFRQKSKRRWECVGNEAT